jgi:hypothetical protein
MATKQAKRTQPSILISSAAMGTVAVTLAGAAIVAAAAA